MSKVRVTELLGADAILGMMDPDVNMKVHLGIDTRWIVAIASGNTEVSLAKASGGAVNQKAYPHQLVIDAVDASGFGWPSAGDCVKFTHNSGIRASGPPTGTNNKMVFLKNSGSTHTFTR